MTLFEATGFELVAAILAALGAVVVGLAARPAWTVGIGIVLTVFSGHWGDLGIAVPLDRVFLGIGAIAAVIRARRDDPHALRTRPIHWVLVVVGVWALVSAVINGTLGEPDTRFALLDRYGLLPFVAFFVAPLAFREERDRRVLLGLLLGLGFYLGVTAVIETTGPRGILLPRYIDNPFIGIHFDRARGPFTEAAANGLVMLMCAFASAVAFANARSRRVRGFAVLVGLLCLLGVLLALTRAVWIAAALASLAALVYGRETRRLAAPFVVVAGVLVLGAFAAIPDLQDRAEQRTEEEQPVWDRRNSDAAAFRMIAERPLIGHGWGAWRTDSLAYYRQSPDFPLTFVRDVHNVLLVNAVEIGLIGAALWLVALLLAVGGAVASRRGPPDLRAWRVALVGLAVAYMIAALSTPLAAATPTLLLWVWAGLSRAPVGAPAAVPQRRPRSARLPLQPALPAPRR